MLTRTRECFLRFKDTLRDCRPVFGLLLQNAATCSVESVALAGYDFAWIDMEHTTLTFEAVERAVIVLENYGCVPLVRVRSNEQNAIGQALDIGVRIVNVPHVDTADDALRAVRAAKYYPLGRRGYSSINRSTGQGSCRLDIEAMKRQNEATMLMVQIESVEAVRSAPAIAAVEGVDAMFIGLADLSQDMGIAPDPAHPELQEAITIVGKAITRAGKIGAIMPSDPASVSVYHELGFNLICCGSDAAIFRGAAESLLARFKNGAAT